MRKICRICGNAAGNPVYIAQEMMLGLRDEFEYFQCSQCACLQISDIPNHIDRYYPEDYYSLRPSLQPKEMRAKRFLKRQRTCYRLTGQGWFGSLVLRMTNNPRLPDWMIQVQIDPDCKILDFGCGNGHLLRHLCNEGFTDLTGFDPYLEEACYDHRGFRILNQEPDGPFAVIMLNHSFEHIADPAKTLSRLHDKLASDGLIVIRIPIVSAAWERYNTNWVQLDAPRHFYLHSVKSMEWLCHQAGFDVTAIEYDSTEFQFWGSEQYSRDIPLHDARSYWNGIETSMFTPQDIEAFRAQATELNRTKAGDQACFILRKSAHKTSCVGKSL